MPSIKIIDQQVVASGEVTGTYNGRAIPLDGCQFFSMQVSNTVDTPANKTFAAAAVTVATDQITIAAHGYTTGLKVQISNPGTLPTGIVAVTDYFVIVIDANTIQLASSLANALAGTAIDITGQGAGTNTVNVTAIGGGTAQLQISNDGLLWSNDGASQAIAASGLLFFTDSVPYGVYIRMVLTVTSGRISSSMNSVVKGPN